MTYITSFLSTLFEFLCIYFTARSFLKQSLVPHRTDILACLFIVTINTAIPSEYAVILWFIAQCFYAFYVIQLNHEKLINRCILFCLTCCLLILTQVVVALVLTLAHIDTSAWYIGLVGTILTLLFLILLLHFRPILSLYMIAIQSALPYRLIMINTYFIVFSLLLLFKMDSPRFYSDPLYFLSVLSLILTANVCISFYDQKLYAKNQEVLFYQKNLPIYETLIHEIRANQHEFSNRIQHLQALPSVCSDYPTICQALLDNAQEYRKPLQSYPLLQIDMPLMAATLYSLSSQADEHAQTIVFDIVSTHLESQISENQLADYVCILVQNAIEACQAGDKIYIRLTSDQGICHFEVRNPCNRYYSPQEIKQFFTKKYSTKPAKTNNETPHGYGLYYLSSQIAKSKGSLGAECMPFENINWMIFSLDI